MNTAICPQCGKKLLVRLRPDTQHWGEIRCPVHGHRFIPKPEEFKKPKRKTNLSLVCFLPSGMQDFCWCCLRSKGFLQALRPSLSLQVHHIIAVEDGGGDNAENLMLLCSECHAEIHRRREAFQRYHSGLNFSE